MKILVVDDSMFSRNRVLNAIKGQGFEIIEASDGVEGFELFQVENPDVVITDLLMPKMNGVELLRTIQETGSKVPVIVITADIQLSSKKLCKDYGAVSFLNKPFQSQALLDAVNKEIGLKCEVGS